MAYTQAWQNQYQIANHVDVIRGDAPARLRRRLGARRHPLVLEHVRRRQHERRSGSDRQRDGRLLARQHDADPAVDAGTVEPGAALRRRLRAGHLANDAAADAELRRPVGAVPAVPTGCRADRPAASASTTSASTTSRRARRAWSFRPRRPGSSYPSQNADGSGPADFDGASAIKRRLNQFAPRVGAAFDPDRIRPHARFAPATASRTSCVQLNVTRASNGTSPWAADLLHRFGTLANPWQGMPGGNPFPFDWRETPLFLPASVVLPFDPGPEHAVHAQLERLATSRSSRAAGASRPATWAISGSACGAWKR